MRPMRVGPVATRLGGDFSAMERPCTARPRCSATGWWLLVGGFARVTTRERPTGGGRKARTFDAARPTLYARPVRTLAVTIATVAGVGRFPIAPGTAGSL